jgi:hypothetical protein
MPLSPLCGTKREFCRPFRPPIRRWLSGNANPAAIIFYFHLLFCFSSSTRLLFRVELALLQWRTLILTRHRTAWKIALSFETACLEGISEERVYSQDHVRAGAVLGKLRLGRAPRSKKAAEKQ